MFETPPITPDACTGRIFTPTTVYLPAPRRAETPSSSMQISRHCSRSVTIHFAITQSVLERLPMTILTRNSLRTEAGFSVTTSAAMDQSPVRFRASVSAPSSTKIAPIRLTTNAGYTTSSTFESQLRLPTFTMSSKMACTHSGFTTTKKIFSQTSHLQAGGGRPVQSRHTG